jgi:putative membrane protein
MKNNFNQPQRQSILGVLILFFDSIRHFAKALFPIILVSLLKIKDLHLTTIIIYLTILVAFFGTIAYLKYLNFTFYLDDKNQEFIVTDGIFNKTKTTIQLNKIQQVNIKQSLIQKLIGVFSLEVDTAGTQKQEISIKAISHEFALNLKQKLLATEKQKIDFDQKTQTFDNENPFVKISFLSLVKVGLTANYLRSFFLLLAFFITTFENIKHVFGEKAISENKIEHYLNKNEFSKSIPILLFIILFVIIMLNLGRIIFKYFDLKIIQQNESLLLSFGLLNTKTTILKPEKVQIISFSSNYFQNKLNTLQLKIKQATSGEKEEQKSAIEIPGCTSRERDEILKLIFQKIPKKGLMLKPNFRKLGFSVFLTIFLPLLAFWIFKDLLPQNKFVYSFVMLYVLIVGIIQFFNFRNNKLFIDSDFIFKKSGAWDVKTEIIEWHKIQAITTSQLFWHKNLNIGSVILHTAGGNISFQLSNFDTIKTYANLWLYKIETSNSNWM